MGCFDLHPNVNTELLTVDIQGRIKTQPTCYTKYLCLLCYCLGYGSFVCQGYKPLIQPKCTSTTYGLKSFAYKGPQIWNVLPNNIKKCLTVEDFKKMIKLWEGPKQCQCVMCVRVLKNGIVDGNV